MKRLHVHLSVENIAASTRFYSTLFAANPTVVKSDYAKWMLDDPRVNFAISKRGGETGVQHLGIQVEERAELKDMYSRLIRADRPVFGEGATTCCYAKSEKRWIADPQGVPWETFLTTGESTDYGIDSPTFPLGVEPAGIQELEATPCCVPTCCAPKAAE
jgi:hypothetical protein